MITIKSGVDIKGIQPEMALAVALLQALDGRWEITSAVRDKGTKSVHPYGYAIDLVPRDEIAKLVDLGRIARILMHQFDVIKHDSGSGMHFHIEFDPR